MSRMGVYKLRNKVNGKIYIGKSVDIKRRLHEHPYHQKQIIAKAIRKYGWKNFEVEILESFDKIDNEILLEKEAKWIQYFDSTNPEKGYNILSFSSDTTGRKHSEATLRKMRKPRSAEARENIRKGNLNKNTRAVQQINPDTSQVIRTWKSIREVYRLLNKPYSSLISMVCNKTKNRKGYQYQTAYGFKWAYVT